MSGTSSSSTESRRKHRRKKSDRDQKKKGIRNEHSDEEDAGSEPSNKGNGKLV